jgi:hypothetical protein
VNESAGPSQSPDARRPRGQRYENINASLIPESVRFQTQFQLSCETPLAEVLERGSMLNVFGVSTFKHSIDQSRRFTMRSKLAFSALVVASLIGSTYAASAQSQPTSGASSQGNVGPGASQGMNKNMDKSGSGMTTGSGSGMQSGSSTDRPTRANPSSQGNVGPGTNQAGSMSK